VRGLCAQGAGTRHGWLRIGFVVLGSVAIGLFRTLWIAALVSNVGTWMQTVDAQWLVVHDAHAAILVSLVQTADTLPAVLFALVAGVLADIFARVKLIVAVLAGMTATGAALTALTSNQSLNPASKNSPGPSWARTEYPGTRRARPRVFDWCPEGHAPIVAAFPGVQASRRCSRQAARPVSTTA